MRSFLETVFTYIKDTALYPCLDVFETSHPLAFSYVSVVWWHYCMLWGKYYRKGHVHLRDRTVDKSS